MIRNIIAYLLFPLLWGMGVVLFNLLGFGAVPYPFLIGFLLGVIGEGFWLYTKGLIKIITKEGNTPW